LQRQGGKEEFLSSDDNSTETPVVAEFESYPSKTRPYHKFTTITKAFGFHTSIFHFKLIDGASRFFSIVFDTLELRDAFARTAPDRPQPIHVVAA